MYRVKNFLFCKKTSSLAILDNINPKLRVVEAKPTDFTGVSLCTLDDGRKIEVPDEALVQVSE